MNSALLTIFVSIISVVITWLLSRDKYRVDVRSKEIENTDKVFDTYNKIVEMNTRRMEELISQCTENKREILKLKKVINRILQDSCIVKSCKLRQVYEEPDIVKLTEKIPNSDILEKN